MDRPSEAELEAAIDSVMNPPHVSAAASEQRHSLVNEVKRLSLEELARVQALAGADEWFLEGDGHPVGPLTIAQMKERWLAHSIRPESRCWGVGLPGWTPLCRITALARALGPQPAYPIRTPRPPPPAAEAKKEMPSEVAAPLTDHTRPTRPRPMLREEILYEAALSQLARSANARPASREEPPPAHPDQASSEELSEHLRYEVVPAPRARSRRTRPHESSDDLPALLPEPARPTRRRSPARDESPDEAPSADAASARRALREEIPARARSSGTYRQWSSEEPPEEDAPVSRSTNRALRALVGAMIGLSAFAILLALMTLPPLLSPPKPRPLAPETTVVTHAAPMPLLAPVAARQPAPERPVKKSTASEPDPDPTPVPTADPETEAAFDRVFGPPEASRPVPKPASVYIPPAPPKPRGRLSDADVMAVVVSHKAQLVKCRDQARAKDPELAGRLLVRWTVSPDGDPEGVESLLSDLQDTDLDACVTQVIRGWKFPRHTAEQPPITFPFVF